MSAMRISDPISVTMMEPAQPSRFEKKMNMRRPLLKRAAI
jgi:hypothetical protein